MLFFLHGSADVFTCFRGLIKGAVARSKRRMAPIEENTRSFVFSWRPSRSEFYVSLVRMRAGVVE